MCSTLQNMDQQKDKAGAEFCLKVMGDAKAMPLAKYNERGRADLR
jgi:hypothetical protein